MLDMGYDRRVYGVMRIGDFLRVSRRKGVRASSARARRSMIPGGQAIRTFWSLSGEGEGVDWIGLNFGE